MQEKNQYLYADIQNFIGNKRIRSFQKENDNNETYSSSSNDETTPKHKRSFGRNKNAKFNEFMVRKCGNLLMADKVLFKTRKFFPRFVLAPLRSFLNLNLDRLSLLQLEREMYSTGYPDDHKFFELGYCGHTQYPHSKIFLDQARALILLQFQEEYHPFIRKALQDEHIHVVSLYYVHKPKTDTPRTKIR